MFLSFSKTIAKFGGLRIRVGVRKTKKNAIWFSLITVFVLLFKMMWYMLVLCGWMIYALFYGLYWCIKKIVQSIRKKDNTSSKHRSEISTGEMLGTKNNLQNETNENKNEEKINNDDDSAGEKDEILTSGSNENKLKGKSKLVRWIVGVLFVIFALVNGFHFSSVFLFAAAFLMLPFEFTDNFIRKVNIKTFIVVIIAVVLFFIGAITSPTTEKKEGQSANYDQNTSNGNENKPNNQPTGDNGGGNTINSEEQSPITNLFAEDNVVNRFITEFNRNGYSFSNIRKGNIRTKYFAYANGCYVELLNANDAYAKIFSVNIGGGKDTSHQDRMFDVFAQVVQTLDTSVTDAQIKEVIEYLQSQQHMVSNYKISDDVTIETYVPIIELSYGKSDCRIEVVSDNYK